MERTYCDEDRETENVVRTETQIVVATETELWRGQRQTMVKTKTVVRTETEF